MGDYSQDAIFLLAIPTVDPAAPLAIGVGDYSGFTTSHGISEQRVAYIYRGIKGAENVDGIGVCLR